MRSELPLPDRRIVVALTAGIAWVALLTVVLGESRLATIFLDRGGFFPYPFTIQNVLWLLFFLGLGELWLRWRESLREEAFIWEGYLPEDDVTVLRDKDLGPLRRRVAGVSDGDGAHGFVPYLIDLCILQFRASRSVGQTLGVLNGSLDLMSHRLELRYYMLRYLSWVIPTIGFIGTVVGIAQTLAAVDPTNPDLGELTASLSVAFNTTLVALILAAVLVFGINRMERREEASLNQAGTYCLKNLINRLYAGDMD